MSISHTFKIGYELMLRYFLINFNKLLQIRLLIPIFALLTTQISYIMKSVLSICVVALSSLWAMSQDVSVAKIRASAKIIPVVDYSPICFESAIGKAFGSGDDRNCFFLTTDQKNGTELYWLNDYSEKGRFKLSKMSKSLPLSDSQTEILNTVDSVFIFNPCPDIRFEFIPRDIRYIGYRDGGQTRYMSTDRTFDSLSDFIVSEFGSVANFTSLYLEHFGNAFFSPGSGLYGFDSDRAAIDFLKHDYRFNAVCNRQAEETISLFIELLKKAVIVTPAQEARLTKLLADSYKAGDQITSDFLSGKSFEVFRPQTLRAVFSPDEYELIQTAITENKARLAIAYWRISKTIGNSDANGAYLSDRDILKEISKRTF